MGQFARDFVRMVALLFGPLLAGAVIIPIAMLIFAALGFPN